MGIEQNISHTTFPRQGKLLGSRVSVAFNYDTSVSIAGVIVRDDDEAPHRQIIQLIDGRFVLSTECQYHLLND